MADPEKVTQTRRDRYTGDPLQVQHLRIPESFSNRLAVAAKTLRRSKNDTIVLAIQEFLDRNGY